METKRLILQDGVTKENVYKVASFKSECELTSRWIDVKLYTEKDENGFNVATIATEDGVIKLSICDIHGLIESLNNLLDTTT